jgi:hypothetical protein
MTYLKIFVCIPIIFMICRRLFAFALLLTRNWTRNNLYFIAISTFLSTFVSIFLSVKVFNLIFKNITMNLVSLGFISIFLLFFFRLFHLIITKFDPDTSNSNWVIDDKKSDQWNRDQRYKITNIIKTSSLVGVIIGLLITFNFWGLFSIHSIFLMIFVLYLLIGFLMTIIHLGLGFIGGYGIIITILIGVLFWPLLIGYYIWKSDFFLFHFHK